MGNSLFAQSQIFPPLKADANFDSLKSVVDSIFLDSSSVTNYFTQYKAYARALNYYKTRLGSDGTIKKGLEEYNTGKPIADCSNGDWTSLGPFEDFRANRSDLGVVNCVVSDPDNNDLLLAGTPHSGVFRGTTINGEYSWSPVTDNLGFGLLPINKIEFAAYHHDYNSDRSILYASMAGSQEHLEDNPTGFPLLKSNDHGLTWSTVGPSIPIGKVVKGLALNPVNYKTLVYAIDGKVYYSTDGMVTVNQLSGADFSPNLVVDIEWSSNGEEIYISTETDGTSSAQIFKVPVTYSGIYPLPISVSFSTPIDITPTGFVKSNNDPDTIERFYLTTSKESGAEDKLITVGLAKSNGKRFNYVVSHNNGATWGTITTKSHSNVNEIFSSPINSDNLLVATMAYDFVRFQNFPNNYTTHTWDTFHVDIRWVDWTENANGEDVIIVAHDGGLQKFVGNFENDDLNTITNWDRINGIGLNIAEIFNFDFDENRNIVTGHMHNYSNIYFKETNNWGEYRHGIGDGSGIHADKMEPSRVIVQGNGCFYTENPNGNLFLPTVYDNTFEANKNCGDEYNLMDMPFSQNSLAPENYLVGVKNLHFSSNRGKGFYGLLSGITSETPLITALSYAPNNPNVAYFARNITSPNPSGMKIFNKIENLSTQNPTVTDLSFPNSANYDNANFIDAFYRGFIREIIVSPNNENQFWVGFSGYHHPSFNRRVFYSNDGGVNWLDKTHNFPNVPVNCMQIDWKNKIIYAGTDFGVYYKELYANEWDCFSGGLGAGAVNNIKIDYCSNKLVAAVYGRGMWEVDLPNTINVTPIALEINQTQTINNNNTFNYDVRIKNNSTLTLQNCTWSFAKGAKLIVEPGSKLILNNATLTSLCPNQMWDGVVINNINGYLKQFDFTNGKPGRMEMKNDAIIENALVGVSVGNKNQKSKNGGIFKAYNSTFKNCEIAVAFYPYKEVSTSGLILKNKSVLQSCTFYTNADYLDFENSTNPHEFIYAQEISGLDIIANTFENKNPTSFSAGGRGFGIWAYDSKLNIIGKCPSNTTYPPTCNPSSVTPNTFKNLFYGIRNASINDFYTTRVDYATFDGNIRGIYLINQTAAQVTNSNFDPASLEVLAENSLPVNTAYGVYLHECTDYLITDNNFESYIGTYVYNLNPYAAKTNIYKNYFNSDRAGIVGIKENRGPFNSIKNDYEERYGFQFQCNEFDRTKYDVFVTDEPGISMMVGSPNSSQELAGNLFDGCTVTNGELNDQTLGFDYHHHNNSNYTPATGCYSSNIVSVNFGDGFEEGDCPAKVYETIGDLNSPLNDALSYISSQNSLTPKDEEWQTEMGYLQHNFQLIYSDIFNNLAHQDSNINQHDSLMEILALQDTNNFRNAQLGSWYLFQEDFENANTVFDSLATDSVFANYAAVQSKIAELIEDTANLTTLTGDDSSFFTPTTTILP